MFGNRRCVISVWMKLSSTVDSNTHFANRVVDTFDMSLLSLDLEHVIVIVHHISISVEQSAMYACSFFNMLASAISVATRVVDVSCTLSLS
jgi:hypothetical protein